MKRLLLILLTACGLTACEKDQVNLNSQTFEVGYKQTTTVPITISSSVQVTLAELADSRCPTGVVCITGGTIAATVQLTDALATQTVRLGYEKNYSRDSVSISLNNQSYWVRLLDVNPYPSTTNSGQLRVATLRLRPR